MPLIILRSSSHLEYQSWENGNLCMAPTGHLAVQKGDWVRGSHVSQNDFFFSCQRKASICYYSHYRGTSLIYCNTGNCSCLWLPMLSESPHPGGIWKYRRPLVGIFGWGAWLVLLIQFEESQLAQFKRFPEQPECKLLCDSSIFLSPYWKFLNVVSEIGFSLSHSHFSVTLDLEGLARNWSCRAITRG